MSGLPTPTTDTKVVEKVMLDHVHELLEEPVEELVSEC